MIGRKMAVLMGPAAFSLLVAGTSASALSGPQGFLATGHGTKPRVILAQAVTDLGPADPNQSVSLSVVLKMQNTVRLANYIEQTENPASVDFHKFLTTGEFRGEYAPSVADVQALVQYFNDHGIQSYAYGDGLLVKAMGPASAFESLFKVQIEDFQEGGQTFYAVSKSLTFPKQFSNLILTSVGLDNYAAFLPQIMVLKQIGPEALADASTPVKLPKHGTATHIPGQYTAGDAANIYNANGLYEKGINGRGETIGIATFADFHVPDVYHYWNSIHLKYQPDRVRQIFVDGGGQIGQTAGSGETALDVEQAGGIAPDANIAVYDAANTDEGFLDVFYQAASDNVVNSLSISWGSPELFYLASGSQGQLVAMHQAFMENAAQGITTFAAAGDSGAYDVNAALPYPFASRVVSIDAPSSDPYVTAVSGTTMAGSIKLKKGWVNVPEMRAWGWDYLTNYINSFYGQFALYTNNIFPVGGGGGVSSVWPLPYYQQGISTIQKTTSAQPLVDMTQSPPSVYYTLKGGFAGRNTPDLALNADPYTGYLLYSTPDGGWVKNVGGTSVTAPQMNGMTALLDEYTGSRLGLLNPALYTMARDHAYGPGEPLTEITAGDNWFYNAIPGYNQATGVGSPNVTNLAVWLKQQAAGAVGASTASTQSKGLN